MKKKDINIILLLAAAGIGFVLINQMMRRRSGTVMVDSAEKITEEEFTTRPTMEAPSVIESVTSVVKTLFPPRTAEERAARRQRRTQQPVTKSIQEQSVPARFKVLAAAAAAARKAAPLTAARKAGAAAAPKMRIGSMDNISILY